MPNYRYDVIVLCVLICLRIDCSLGMNMNKYDLGLQERTIDGSLGYHNHECHAKMLKTEAGSYSYVSDGRRQFCSLYIVAPMDTLVQFEFTAFDVSCEGNSALALLDGWEVDQDFFPSESDHPQPFGNRYVQFCGDQQPTGRYVAKQNAAQIQFYVPFEGEGFRVQVTFKPNKKPCNMLLMGNNFQYLALKNYGLQRNCSVLSLFPQEVTFSQFDVGERRKGLLSYVDHVTYDGGLRTTCREGRSTDRIELYRGVNVGEWGRFMVLGFCGRRYIKAPLPMALACESTTIRLVSSGNFYNSLTFSLTPTRKDKSAC